MKSAHAHALAQYNQWMNERLYDVCDTLSDEARKLDRGAFFKSVHGTLNHLLLGDRIWLGRFQQMPFPVESLAEVLYDDWNELRDERSHTDQAIIDWAETLTDETLSERLGFTSIVATGPRNCPLWVAVTHFFNHQTHHRGQLTTLLSQLGKDPGVTDFLWLPGMLDQPS